MADDADFAGGLVDREVESIMLDHRMQKSKGSPFCECGEPISSLRQEMGATLCLECKELEEKGRK